MRRFEVQTCGGCGVLEDPNGEYVLYEDVPGLVEADGLSAAEWKRSYGEQLKLAEIAINEQKRLLFEIERLQAELSGMHRRAQQAEAELKALRETLAARQTAAEYSRRREEAEAARARVLEMERDEARRIAVQLHRDWLAEGIPEEEITIAGGAPDWLFDDDPPT